MLQSSRHQDHMNTIGIDQTSLTGSSYYHRCMNNINKIYQHVGKCDDQQNLKDVIDAVILSTWEWVTDNSPNVPMISTPLNKTSAMKSLCLFINIFGVKPKIEKCCIVAEKSKRKVMKFGNKLWTKKRKRKGHSTINDQIKRNLYTWITCHDELFYHQFLMIVSKLC